MALAVMMAVFLCALQTMASKYKNVMVLKIDVDECEVCSQ